MRPPILLADSTRQHFFLVPQDANILGSDLDLYTLLGRQVWVDPDLAAPYYITRAEAEAWLGGQIRGTLDQIGESVKKWIWRYYTHGHPQTPAPPKPRLNIDLLADLMGESVENLKQDADARRRGWIKLFREFSPLLEDALSGDPERLAQARDQLRAAYSWLSQEPDSGSG